MENKELKKKFADIQCKYREIESERKMVMKETVDFKGSTSYYTTNVMYVSPEVGTVSDETIGVYTSTVFTEDIDANNEVIPNDVVTLRATDADGHEIHVLLSRYDCIDLIRHISTAVSLLRGD